MVQVKISLTDGTTFKRNIPRVPSWGKYDDSLVDLHSVANSIFISEDYIRYSKEIACIEIPLRNGFSSSLKDALEDIYFDLFHYTPDFKLGNIRETSFADPEVSWSDGYTCLFSCGLDSYAGILAASNLFPVVGAFTHHPDFQTLPQRAEIIRSKVLAPNNIELKTIVAPRHKPAMKLTRGILYVLNAVLVRNKNIIVPEIGPTMYQPPFTLLDELSITTRPHILKAATEIVKAVTGQGIKIIKPNEDLTKAEVAAISPFPKFIKGTHSCRTPRWANAERSHCGSCYGCAVRRLATEVAGVNDAQYRKSGFTGKGIENIAQLIRFSADFLSNKSLPSYTMEIIERYHKQELFKRFALDNLAGLVLMSDRHIENSEQRKLLELTLSDIDRDELDDRIAVVRNKSRKPNFS